MSDLKEHIIDYFTKKLVITKNLYELTFEDIDYIISMIRVNFKRMAEDEKRKALELKAEVEKAIEDLKSFGEK
jgi:hypothetical protein